MDYCPHCATRLVRVEKVGNTFKATDQDSGEAVEIPEEVQAAYANGGNIPLSFACREGWPLSYRGIATERSIYSRSGAQHVTGEDRSTVSVTVSPARSDLISIDPFNPNPNARFRAR